MNEITVSAKTLDGAITEALIQLGVTSDQIEYDVIEKGSAGFLGIGSKQAVIRARKKKREDETSIDELKKEIVSNVSSIKHTETVKPAKAPDHSKYEAKEEKREEKPKSEKSEKLEKAEKPVKEFSEKKASYTDKYADKKKADKAKVQEIAKPERKETELAEVSEEAKNACEVFLKDVMKTMGMEVEITSKIDTDGALSIDMKGDNMGILIGKRGQTLDSLQYLTNRVANKYQEGYIRVKLDTENYRKRRKDTLENLAKNIAYKVKRTKKPVSLEPMNPYERRIIHSALQGDRYVTTHSEGEEPYRRVVVTLAKR